MGKARVGSKTDARRPPGQGSARSPEEALRRDRASRRGSGQSIIEVLLILPIFLMLVFSIMEIGHLSFRMIVLQHAAYEVARIGSLTTTPYYAQENCPSPMLNTQHMQQVATQILGDARYVNTGQGPIPTLMDNQSQCMNYDVVVTLQENVQLLFGFLTGIFLNSPCGQSRGNQSRCLEATVRMPIERPLFR